VKGHGCREDIILAHTCPYDHRPVECFISGVDEKMVDNSMERFLQEIVNMAEYRAFYCGHWHIDKHDAKIRFLFRDIVMLDGTAAD
jgi:3-oxoacid CoA-transferase subunit A